VKKFIDYCYKKQILKMLRKQLVLKMFFWILFV